MEEVANVLSSPVLSPKPAFAEIRGLQWLPVTDSPLVKQTDVSLCPSLMKGGHFEINSSLPTLHLLAGNKN